MDSKTVEELRGLAEKATPGPWHYAEREGRFLFKIMSASVYVAETSWHDASPIYPTKVGSEANFALIVAMRNALPALLDLAASLASAGEDGLCKALTSYQQADEDGVMVLVSRQACDEAATRIRALASQVDGLRREIEIRDPVAKRREEQLSALRAENERLRKALLRLQTGAAVALDALPEDQREGVVGNFLAAIHRECCAGLCASKGADECKEATP